MCEMANTVPTLWSFLPSAIRKKKRGEEGDGNHTHTHGKRGAQKADLPSVANTFHDWFLLIRFFVSSVTKVNKLKEKYKRQEIIGNMFISLFTYLYKCCKRSIFTEYRQNIETPVAVYLQIQP